MAQDDRLYDEVSRIAFELHEKRGRVHGCDVEDWLEAERIVLARYQKRREGEAGIIKETVQKTPVKSKSKTAKSSQRTPEVTPPRKARKTSTEKK